MKWTIRPERDADASAIDALVMQGFGPGRFAKTAYRLREGVHPEARLSFVAEEEGGGPLLGSVRFWPVKVGSGTSLLLGPLAVQSDLRGRGIGISLMQHGIEQARALGFETVILVGDEPYYARLGFSRLTRGAVRFPGPVDQERVLGLALAAGALDRLAGEVKRARIDVPVSAQSAAL